MDGEEGSRDGRQYLAGVTSARGTIQYGPVIEEEDWWKELHLSEEMHYARDQRMKMPSTDQEAQTE